LQKPAGARAFHPVHAINHFSLFDMQPFQDPNFAPNASQLAQRLGVSRQLIAYHCKQARCPEPIDGWYDVEAWRRYLSEVGRKEIKPASKKLPLAGFNLFRIVANMAEDDLFHKLMGNLPELLAEKVPQLSPDDRGKLATELFAQFALGLACHRTEDHFNGYLTRELRASLDDIWHRCGWGDITGPPKTVKVPVPSTIVADGDGWLEIDPAG
jgi:hypothetical protein